MAPAGFEEECGCLAHRLERADRPTAGPGDGKGGAFDATTGRDHRNFPPNPQVEFRRMQLALRFEDMTGGRFTGIETLTIAPIGVPVTALRLDAAGMKVSSVTVDGRVAEFSRSCSPPLPVVCTFASCFSPSASRRECSPPNGQPRALLQRPRSSTRPL